MSLRTKFDGLRQIWQFDNRYQLLFDRIFFPSQNLVTYRYKGLEFLTDLEGGDANGAREVLATDMYRQFLPKMDLPSSISVFRCQANNGGFPLLLLSEGFQLKTVVCVELNPRTFSRMRFNVERNTDCKFYPINAAVCGENKDLNVSLGKGGVGDNIFGENVSEGLEYSIAGKTFDAIYEETFGDEQVDLCKIDIEGAEFETVSLWKISKIKRLPISLDGNSSRKKTEPRPNGDHRGVKNN